MLDELIRPHPGPLPRERGKRAAPRRKPALPRQTAAHFAPFPGIEVGARVIVSGRPTSTRGRVQVKMSELQEQAGRLPYFSGSGLACALVEGGAGGGRPGIRVRSWSTSRGSELE